MLVSPNRDPEAAEPSEELSVGQGEELLVQHPDNETVPLSSQLRADDTEPTETLSTESATEKPPRFDYPDIPITPKPDTTKTVLLDGSAAPVINLEKDRIANMLADEPAIFEMADSPKAVGKEPGYARHDDGYWAVWVHHHVIEYEAERQGVDPDLVRAIMYVENAHGGAYGRFFELFRWADTILPMNVNPETWGDLVGEDADFSDPLVNIKAGVAVIRRLRDRIKNPTIAKVASPFKFTGRENVNDYGARVAEVFNRRIWEEVPARFADPEGNKMRIRRSFLRQKQEQRDELKRRIEELRNSPE